MNSRYDFIHSFSFLRENCFLFLLTLSLFAHFNFNLISWEFTVCTRIAVKIRQTMRFKICETEARWKSANHFPITPVFALVTQYFKAIRPASASGYNTDEAPNDSSITVELFVLVRNNGRILDGTRHVLGGQDFEAVFKLNKLSSDEVMRKWTVHMCRHPRNIFLRPGMLSSQ